MDDQNELNGPTDSSGALSKISVIQFKNKFNNTFTHVYLLLTGTRTSKISDETVLNLRKQQVQCQILSAGQKLPIQLDLPVFIPIFVLHSPYISMIL